MADDGYSLQELFALRVEALQLLRTLGKLRAHLDEDIFLLRRLVREQETLVKTLTSDELEERLLHHLLPLLGMASRVHLRLQEGEVKALLAVQLLALMEKLPHLHRAVTQRS